MRRLVEATDHLKNERAPSGLTIADEKTAVAASTRSVARRLGRSLGVQEVHAEQDGAGRRATFLGADFAAGRARASWKRWSQRRRRLRTVFLRRARVARLRAGGGGVRTKLLASAGIIPQGAYAADITGLDDAEWRDLRLSSLAASGGHGGGRS